MKKIKFKFLFVWAILCSIALGSCDMQDNEIQIPERVFGHLIILQKDLTIEARAGSSLSFDYQVNHGKL